MGVILIYGFFSETDRVLSISVAGFSKVVFVSLVLFYGREFLGKAAPAIIMDCAVIILTGFYLVAVGAQRSAA